ncbi:RNB domain-containing ribonuclease [Achromobacter sp. GG226]|uniref:ribonuclease catalytic domain-containing protein n=1 Tax=Verticiella alkaliphila TaxID=2779529 RepID=UPI001C0E6890|nr:RNB domain-containing ribonuclease [Verticiella sp. GG226]MBU4612918.1 RNB domain-containing ribonuclease [Verticiella sp. GG226]
MHVLYEDDGSFKAATIFNEADASLQVEAASGKRSKIKKNNVILRFASPEPAELLRQAEAAAQELDPPFLWEVAPKDEFAVADLAAEYFGHTPSPVEETAVLLSLHAAPVYFHRRGRGRYRPAPPDILEAALAALEKKKRQAEQQQAWADEMLAGTLPEAIGRQADALAFRPDKNSQEWKALDLACQQSQKSAIRLLLELGAWPHPLALLRRRFLQEHFGRGVEFAPVEIPTHAEPPLADVQAYSFDDTVTTEIDDALSVREIDDTHIRVGVHIAAPALGVTRDSPLDVLARARMSTVYMPGDKIPMQPDEVIRAYSLDAGRPVPALSLYTTIDTLTGDVTDVETKLETLAIAANLRHPVLEPLVSEAALEDAERELPHPELLRPLWRGAKALLRVRETVRGKPELNNRVEYSFYVDGDPHDPDNAHVRIVPRQRGAPLDRMVAEYMILANSVWGGILAQHGVPGIYRSQQAGRVRMSTHALPHEAMGVPQYAWCTSPLRRYVDLVNQQQLIAIAEHGISAPLAAPFKPKDAELFAIIGAFEAKHAAYHEFQDAMERYWCLRWLQQEGVTRTDAVVVRDDVVRLADLPFYTRIPGLPQLARGHVVSLDIIGIDEVELTLECRYAGDGTPADAQDMGFVPQEAEPVPVDAATVPAPTDKPEGEPPGVS